MEKLLFKKIYTKVNHLTKATCTLEASGVGYEELAVVDGKSAQVVKINGNQVTLQVFVGTEGIRTDAEVVFFGKAPSLKVSDELGGRFFNAFGEPIDGKFAPQGKDVEIGGPSINPVRRKQPFDLIETGIAGIDLNNTLLGGQKIPFFADADQPYNAVIGLVALRSNADRIILGGMGLSNDDYLYFKNLFLNADMPDKITGFINTTDDATVERLLVPDMALAAAEYFAIEKNQKVLVLLTDMTLYCDALSIVSNRMDQIPSKDSMPGSLYSDLAKIYEKSVQLPSGGSITIISVTTISEGDITHAIPDNTGYITEGQLFLRRDTEISKVIIDPFRSLSRLKQFVIGKQTREDHPQVMNAAIRLYADAANARTKQENGFDLNDYDKRTLKFAKEYAQKILAIDVNLDLSSMLNICWNLFKLNFKPEELGIRQKYIDQYWEKAGEPQEDGRAISVENSYSIDSSFKQRNKLEVKWP
jgi:V/A-type H+-transporting ATPase subunit B